MRCITVLFAIFIHLCMTSLKITAQDVPIQAVESILIYESGRVFSINPQTKETQDIAQFSTDFMLEPNSTASWTEYDKLRKRIYMIVGREPWDPRTGKQLSSVVALDLVTSKVEILYTDYYLVGATISPDGTKLLIHHYKVGSHSLMPMASQVCILTMPKNLCQYTDLKGIANHFVWFDEWAFATPLLGTLYVCKTDKVNCESQQGLEDVYVDRVNKTRQPDQLLIAGQMTQYDGTVHYFYFDIGTHKRVELEQPREKPIYNSDNLAVIQDAIGQMSLSAKGRYLMVTNELIQAEFRVFDLSTGQSDTFQGFPPLWIADSNTLVGISFQQDTKSVYSLDVETGKKTTLYTTNRPFNLIVP